LPLFIDVEKIDKGRNMKKPGMIITCLFLVFNLSAAANQPIDTFDNTDSWKTDKPAGTEIKLSIMKDKAGNSLQISYDLGSDGAYVLTSRQVDLTPGESYQFSFDLKGTGPDNNLEFKLFDELGNVFWKKSEKYHFPEDWRKIIVRADEIIYAWGPSQKNRPVKIKKIEVGISRAAGGKGEVQIRNLAFSESGTKGESSGKKITSEASTFENENLSPQKAVDGNMGTRWGSEFSDPQWLILDLGEIRQINGIIINWEAGYGKEYEILLSTDKQNWDKVFSTSEGEGGEENIDFDTHPGRYLKFYGKRRGTGWGYSIYEMAAKTVEEPFGIGRPEPDVILKSKWDIRNKPDKNIFIPQSWENQDVIFLASASPLEYELKINGKVISVLKGSKKPVRINIKNAVRCGIPNVFSIRSKDSTEETILRSVLLVKNSETARIESLRNTDPTAYYRFLADLYPEGYFPLWLNNKQDYWTILGTEDSTEESLFSEKGLISAYTKSFSLMPFLFFNGDFITFGDVKIDLSLEDGYLPIPTVVWNHDGLKFSQKLFSFEKNGKSMTGIIYKLENISGKPAKGKLFLALRPFEVNPPWMHGGLTEIRSVSSADNNKRIKINRTRGLIALTPADEFGAAAYKDGEPVLKLAEGDIPSNPSVDDPQGRASGVLSYNFNLQSGGQKEYDFILPLDSDIGAYAIPEESDFAKDYEASKQGWTERLNQIGINIPEKKITDVLRANIAYMLINKDGPALQPGSRSYENSWIRDGSLISASLLRTSGPDVSRNYISWVASKQATNGEIPCILNAKTGRLIDYALDWREDDSTGEFIFAVADVYNFTKDKKFAAEMFPHVEKALRYVEKLRLPMLDQKYKGTSSYGILPRGISHEGYLGNPQQSLWDDFWTLKGWKDGQMLAKAVGKADLVPWMMSQEKDLRNCLLEDIRLVQANRHIQYIPSSIALAEFDAISMSILLYPTLEYQYLDLDQVKGMFDRYYKDEFIPRQQRNLPVTFIPYEIRGAHSFILLDQREKALEMIRYFLNYIRPAEWKEWAEVVSADRPAPVYLGDMPHSWIGSIYVETIRDMFIHEDKGSLVLAAGIDGKWLDQAEGVSVRDMPSFFGKTSYSIKKSGDTVMAHVEGTAEPEKGFVFKSPFPDRKITGVKVNNKKWDNFTDKDVSFPETPAEIEIKY
jgi:hypothetical protein